MNIFQKGHPFIIAEIGTAHGGSFEEAQKLIEAAAAAGADCVKFQIVYADEILHPDTGFVSLPGGNIRLYDRFKELEVTKNFFFRCKDYCKICGIGFCASPFGLQSLDELIALEPFAIKIASPELNHLPLLARTAAKAKDIPIILSSGVSKLKDIEKALDTIKKNRSNKNMDNIALLHCVTSYPAPETDYNLNVLEPLSKIFGIDIGVSDHSLDPILVPVLATACGASVIEKHICLSKDGNGLDDPVALIPEDFKKMVETVRQAESSTKEENITALNRFYGVEKVKAVLGTGVKKLARSEEKNYERTNRSIHFMHNMKSGDKIGFNDIAILRTEKVLTTGLHPSFMPEIMNAVLVKDAASGEGVTLSHFIMKQPVLKHGLLNKCLDKNVNVKE
ncbi:MAG: spore coat protein [Treponema sp.]|jgi:sialic acid synthase SpsE|nr:spore coat protein [Treponema sp.]